MDQSRTIAEHSIRRIVVVLLALADLAERASGRSVPVRSLVFWLLRSGEVVARNHLAGLTQNPGGPCQPLALTGDDSAGESIRLASSFRQLAVALTTLAAGLASAREASAAGCGRPLFVKPIATGRLVPPSGSTPAVCGLDSS